MPAILSLCTVKDHLLAAGPDGLYAVEGDSLREIPQPQGSLSCCAASGDFILAGGAPYGVAVSDDGGAGWQAAFIDDAKMPVLCLSAQVADGRSAVVLAGTQGGGILRSHDYGQRWAACNVGLQNYTVVALGWAPPAPEGVWPRWDVVFAGTDEGIYRSPNGGLAWKACAGIQSGVQVVAVAPDFHSSGVVLAGTENDGLWRSDDGGRSFEPVAGAPQQINALAVSAGGWLMSDTEGLWHSSDGLSWHSLPNSDPALVLFAAADGIWAGSETGVSLLAPVV